MTLTRRIALAGVLSLLLVASGVLTLGGLDRPVQSSLTGWAPSWLSALTTSI